jgi:chlorite dismutase
MADNDLPEVPQTLEGWYVLHDVYEIDWPEWRQLDDTEREEVRLQAVDWAQRAADPGDGDSAFYSVVSQKGDVMFVHYRRTPEELNRLELELRATDFFDFLLPAYSYFSVIEVSLNEVMAIAMKRLGDRGIRPGTEEFETAKEEEIAKQKERMDERLYRDVPPQKYICFYPMNKKRGETVNWYTLPMSERRQMMRGHGSIGHKYHETVTQIIGGSIGLDDWEWGVSLHSEDTLVFKKLIHEMRFDPASALFAEFGPFYVGIKRTPDQLGALLDAKLV